MFITKGKKAGKLGSKEKVISRPEDFYTHNNFSKVFSKVMNISSEQIICFGKNGCHEHWFIFIRKSHGAVHVCWVRLLSYLHADHIRFEFPQLFSGSEVSPGLFNVTYLDTIRIHFFLLLKPHKRSRVERP